MGDRIPHGNDCGERLTVGSEVCGCILAPGHAEQMHECSCGRRWEAARG